MSFYGKATSAQRTNIPNIQLDQFTTRQGIKDTTAWVSPTAGRYDAIFGRDFLLRSGIDLMYSEETIAWHGIELPMPVEENSEAQRIENKDGKMTANVYQQI